MPSELYSKAGEAITEAYNEAQQNSNGTEELSQNEYISIALKTWKLLYIPDDMAACAAIYAVSEDTFGHIEPIWNMTEAVQKVFDMGRFNGLTVCKLFTGSERAAKDVDPDYEKTRSYHCYNYEYVNCDPSESEYIKNREKDFKCTCEANEDIFSEVERLYHFHLNVDGYRDYLASDIAEQARAAGAGDITAICMGFHAADHFGWAPQTNVDALAANYVSDNGQDFVRDTAESVAKNQYGWYDPED